MVGMKRSRAIPVFVLGGVIFCSTFARATDPGTDDTSGDPCTKATPAYAELVASTCQEVPDTCEELKTFRTCVGELLATKLAAIDDTDQKGILQMRADAVNTGPYSRCVKKKRKALSCEAARTGRGSGTGAGGGGSADPTLTSAPLVIAQKTGLHEVVYATIPGVDPSLLSLDIIGRTGSNAPVLIYIHGGSWQKGDKKAVHSKPALADEIGAVFVSINYRLSPQAKHPDHVNDVAAAVKWVSENAAVYGGSADKIIIMGHSAGAHLASLVATHPSYLAAQGLSPSKIVCVVHLDGTIDLTDKIIDNERSQDVVAQAFGTDLEVLRDASPVNHIASLKGSGARFLLIGRGGADRQNVYKNFIANYNSEDASSRGDSQYFNAAPYSHAEVNKKVGEDTKLTPIVEDFLRRCAN